jgi:hypothetical protein
MYIQSKVEFIIVHRQISAKCMLRSFRFSPYNLNIKYIKHHGPVYRSEIKLMAMKCDVN